MRFFLFLFFRPRCNCREPYCHTWWAKQRGKWDLSRCPEPPDPALRRSRYRGLCYDCYAHKHFGS